MTPLPPVPPRTMERTAADAGSAGPRRLADRARASLRLSVLLVSLTCLGNVAVAASPVRSTDRSVAATAADDPLAEVIAAAAQRFVIPARWIRAVIEVESGGDARATSPQGAMGLMQIPPETWAELRARYHLGDDPYAPEDNTMAGAARLRELFDRYGAEGLLAAYVAGPRRYDEHLKTGRPLSPEVQIRVAHLLPLIGTMSTDAATTSRSDEPAWTTSPLFVGRVVIGPNADRPQTEDRSVERSAVGSVGAEPPAGRRSDATETRALLFVSRAPAGPGR